MGPGPGGYSWAMITGAKIWMGSARGRQPGAGSGGAGRARNLNCRGRTRGCGPARLRWRGGTGAATHPQGTSARGVARCSGPKTEFYAAKLLEISAGHRTSLQHHARKTETLLILEGTVRAEVETDGRLTMRMLGPGQSLHLPAGTRHRLGSLDGARLVEVSTPELEDVVRHEDDYGRVPPVA